MTSRSNTIMGVTTFLKSVLFTKWIIKYALVAGVVIWMLLFVVAFRNRSNLVKSVRANTNNSQYDQQDTKRPGQNLTSRHDRQFSRRLGVESTSRHEQNSSRHDHRTSDRHGKDLSNKQEEQSHDKRVPNRPEQAESSRHKEQTVRTPGQSPKGRQVQPSSRHDKQTSSNNYQTVSNRPDKSDSRRHDKHNSSTHANPASSTKTVIPQTKGKTSTSPHQHSSYGHCESEDFQHFDNVNKTSTVYFTNEFKLSEEPIRAWLTNEEKLCGGSVKIYGKRFGILHDVVINPREIVNSDNVAKGGEGINEVKAQNLDKEDYKFNRGVFEIECNESDAFAVTHNNRYERLHQLKLVPDINAGAINGTVNRDVEKYTLAIAREDYANLWNHIFELYGAFVLMMVIKKQPEEISILFLDGHPSCMLDKNWEHIFGPVQRVGRLEGPVLYKNLIWGLAENKIPLSKWENPSCPYVEEFRTFVLNQYDIVENAKRLNCERLTFTFIVRRNQVYHPRNLEGNVERKIFNELEVIETLMDRFPGVCIQALLMESIPMRAQLEIITETDVLIGMHGAGMMHATFLPKHAGVVELFPREWRKSRKHSVMYQVLSEKWRKLKYGYWQNPEQHREFSEKVTIVDVEKVYLEVKAVLDRMCS